MSMELRARSSAFCQREFAFRATATFSCRWLICVRIMIFSLAEIMSLFPRSGGSNRMQHCNRPEQNWTPSQPILPGVILIQTLGVRFPQSCSWNLQLARGLARRKELAVRAALGASRWDLARQMLMESGVVALLGGICAVLIALWSLDTIRALVPPKVPRFQETNIDGVVLGITTIISVLAGLLVGMWPAFRVSNTSSVASELHEEAARGSSGAQRQRARGALVIAQVALAVVLLAAAGLTLKSFWRSQQVPLGFDPRGVLTMTIALPSSRYDSPEKISRFYDP